MLSQHVPMSQVGLLGCEACSRCGGQGRKGNRRYSHTACRGVPVEARTPARWSAHRGARIPPGDGSTPPRRCRVTAESMSTHLRVMDEGGSVCHSSEGGLILMGDTREE